MSQREHKMPSSIDKMRGFFKNFFAKREIAPIYDLLFILYSSRTKIVKKTPTMDIEADDKTDNASDFNPGKAKSINGIPKKA